MDITQKTLEKIQEEHVTPIPQWQFLVRGYGLWIISAILVIFGSLGVASMLYIVTKNDWDIYSEIHESKLTHIIATLPYLWLAIFIAMLVFLYIDLRNTKHGYKYSGLTLILSTVVLSVMIGTGLHAVGIGQMLDQAIREAAPRQAFMFNPRLRGLSQPEHGVIMGIVTQIDPISSTTTHILIKNPLLEDRWVVIVAEDTILPPQGIHLRDHIRALGEQIENIGQDEALFLANVILPFNELKEEFRPQGGPPPELKQRLHARIEAQKLPN